MPTGRINAMAILLDKTDYIIVADAGLQVFGLLLSKLVATAFSETHSGASQRFSLNLENVRNREVVQQRFTELVVAYVIKGHPAAAPAYLLDRPQQTLATLLRESMFLFVLGHEYSHIICGHLASSAESLTNVGGESFKEITRNWDMELEADAWGMALQAAAMIRRRTPTAIACLAPELFFSTIEILDLALNVMQSTTQSRRGANADSHPPVEKRREAIRYYYAVTAELEREASKLGRIPHVPKEQTLKADEIVNMMSTMQQFIRSLWDSTQCSLSTLRAQGARPAACWR
jgi:hypothetical protein